MGVTDFYLFCNGRDCNGCVYCDSGNIETCKKRYEDDKDEWNKIDNNQLDESDYSDKMWDNDDYAIRDADY